MKNNHIQTAVKALKRQLTKFENDRDRWEASENGARDNKEFFIGEIDKLKKQIADLEGAEVKELSLT